MYVEEEKYIIIRIKYVAQQLENQLVASDFLSSHSLFSLHHPSQSHRIFSIFIFTCLE